MPIIKLDRGDVSVRPRPVEECEDCEYPATHQLWLDFRNLGSSRVIGNFCEHHAEVNRRDLEEILPEAIEK